MQNYNYESIKKTIHKWHHNNLNNNESYSDCCKISKDEKDALIIDMTFEHCLAQLTVSEPDFAPFKFVSFEAMTCDSKKASEKGGFELVYFFYDSADMLKNEVIEELNLGVEFSKNYKPDELGNNFIGKTGILNTENKKASQILHPDDLEKFTIELLRDEFICVDTQFQYLVIKNAEILLRVLPRVFIIK